MFVMNIIQLNMRNFRLPLFWDVTQRKFKLICRRFGTYFGPWRRDL